MQVFGSKGWVEVGDVEHLTTWQMKACFFDPANVGISALEKHNDLPGGGARAMRRPRGVHGVWVNGLQVFDGEKYVARQCGPGHVLRTFDA